ncbi:RDD family protein [Micromonospora zhanjiangensis]|uniref:RDD family protein n=1 Tax=Micromonospora zhanjiangensis TaxID=1522057 RepID=A0ABV8KED7_9ACTN
MTQPPYAANPAGAQPWDPAGRPDVPRQWEPPGHRPMPGPGGHPPFPPPPVSPAGQPLAGFGDRFLAHLIDSAIFVAVGMVLAVPAVLIVLFTVLPDAVRVDPDGTVPPPDFLDVFLPLLWVELGLFALMIILAYVYYVEMMFRSGQTFGKKTMKLRVVPLDPAETLGRGHAARRYLVQYPASAVVPFLSYLDGLWQLWDKPYQQCLHDKFARTVVVKVPG